MTLQAKAPGRATAWLSEGLEGLIHRLPALCTPDGFHFDVVVVGSGYGGAVAAAELAGAQSDGRPLSVCVLERGREYLGGSFPSRLADLPRQVRFSTPAAPSPRGSRVGLYDLRTGPDVHTLVANGLGGGSLVNAGVMALPLDAVFAEAGWPQALRGGVGAHAQRLLPLLGAAPAAPAVLGAKHQMLQALAAGAGQRVVVPPITVATGAASRSSSQVQLAACTRCGDCALGCNHGAKNSLDLGLLASAHAAGAQLYTGATVLHVEPLPRAAPGVSGWSLHLNHTDERLRRRQVTPPHITLTARRVVLAAGTLGSTEILLRSTRRRPDLRVSSQLGRRFSANGDMLAVLFGTGRDADAVADEASDPLRGRTVGPTITGMIDLRQGDPDTDMVVQDLGVPGPLARVFAEALTTTNFLFGLTEPNRRRGADAVDDCAVDPEAVRRSLALAVIGRDAADGELRWPEAADGPLDDGVLQVHWPALRADPRLQRRLDRLGQWLATAGLGGRALPNPLWQAAPPALARRFGLGPGPLVSVHPLGGCVMADSVSHGVVDHLGRVFDAATLDGVHEGLVVLDGAIIPGSLGINPALTIASVALRAVDGLRAAWGLDAGTAAGRPALAQQRPVFRHAAPVVAPPPTQVELVERLRGHAYIGGITPQHRREIELTLRSRPTGVADLMQARGPRTLHFDPAQSRLRVLQGGGAAASVETDLAVHGSLSVLALEPGTPLTRCLAVLPQWLAARQGPIWQRLWHGIAHLPHLLRAGTHAGTARRLVYDLHTDAGPIRAVKRLRFQPGSNAWMQLGEATLQQFPGLHHGPGPAPVLRLDLPFLAGQGVPLLRLVAEPDKPGAWLDLAALGLYLARVLLQIHQWSLHAPPPQPARLAQRLPGVVPGLPPPQVFEFDVPTRLDQDDGGVQWTQARVRLTRYAPPGDGRGMGHRMHPPAPVMLIHGYSASGTTFAHPALTPGLARVLADAGRDVWILDLRCSAGLAGAGLPWSMEQVGVEDIPRAVERVLAESGAAQVDVVAHCMGSAMACMALLDESAPRVRVGAGGGTLDRPLHQCIRRLVMSQVGPAMRMSPGNVGRAFLLHWVRRALPLAGYTFQVPQRSAGSDLLDRLLATLPSQDEDPPGRPLRPGTATRRRMDLLYGATFRPSQVGDAVLAQLDDFFGPWHPQTLAQTIHFARVQAITDRHGVSRYLDAARIFERLRFPMLHVHGSHNGLVDVSTQDELTRLLGPGRLGPGGSFTTRRFEGFGHQDCLIGRDAMPVLQAIEAFLC